MTQKRIYKDPLVANFQLPEIGTKKGLTATEEGGCLFSCPLGCHFNSLQFRGFNLLATMATLKYIKNKK